MQAEECCSWQEKEVFLGQGARITGRLKAREKMMNKKVMIIDDDKEFLEELQETLSLSGYEVAVVNDPTMIIEKVKVARPDIILLDLKMPNKNGFEVCTELRSCSETADAPVIAMSGFFKDEYMPFLNICGVKKLLKKPFNPLDVITYIETELADGYRKRKDERSR